MPDQIYIGNFNGLKNDKTAFSIDNTSFPTLFNFYAWRGRIKKRRGTSELARLQRTMVSVATPTNPWEVGPIMTLDGSGDGSANIISVFGLESTASITPRSLSDEFLTLTDGTNIFTEPFPVDGTLVSSGAGSGTINYATGDITITGGDIGQDIVGTFSYYPDLPVMGLEDVVSNFTSSDYPILQAFDTKYSYQLNQAADNFFYSTNYYKGTNVPFVWSGQNYQQFWSTNYQSAFWATNNKPGFHFVNGTYTAGSGTNLVTFNFTSLAANYQNLVVGDKLYFNEWNTSTDLNEVTGTVTDATDAVNGNYIVGFTVAPTVAGTGIAQLLTNSISGQDGIKWYDGDPTNATGIPTGNGLGWVNFAPPLTNTNVSVGNQTEAKYYLVGALAIVPFKDRLLFFAPIIQTSTGGPIQQPLQDMVLWSWNGTPYYNEVVPLTVNTVETFDPQAYYQDQIGYGGNLPAGVSDPIKTVISNEDVQLVGFGGGGLKTRLVYTGNDLQPFVFYLINSEMPSGSTYSAISLDRGGIDIGENGICLTTQQSCQRVDLDIPDEVFKIQGLNNGSSRVNAIRDFYREWIYFSYPTGTGDGNNSWIYPSQSFFFNYRDNTWAIFKENYTRHGKFRKTSHYTWQNLPFKTWAEWREPWNAGSTVALFADVIAGNPQGFVVIKDEGTNEAPTGSIYDLGSYIGVLQNTEVFSYNHCVNLGDYLYFNDSIGNTYLNGQIGRVVLTVDENSFVVDIPYETGTYLGCGTYTRLCQPLLQTKQFRVYWDEGRQVRLISHKYLLDSTSSNQVTLNINLSQDADTVWNADPILPSGGVTNSGLEYSQTLYTCPESTNIGLTPANTNLQMPTARSQQQIWHRINTSLIGDTVQLGLTLSDAQMRNLSNATAEIALHGIQLTVTRAGYVA
jgi:hypothetical protein